MGDLESAGYSSVGVDTEAVRQAAAGDVEEANAAIGAALCVGSAPIEFVTLLRKIQIDLLDLTISLTNGSSPQRGRIDAERIVATIKQYQSEPPPSDFAVLGGSSQTVGMLRLARMIVRRAARSMAGLSQLGSSPGEPAIAYLDAVAHLLLVTAFEVELAEAGPLPIGGACGGPPLVGGAHIIHRKVKG